jgi:hypothetical protein
MTYTLSGTDATSFSINGNQLKMAQDVDLDTKSSYSIRSVAEMVATVVPVVAPSAILVVLSWILLGVMSLISVMVMVKCLSNEW